MSDDEQDYALLIPFVCCRSNGGAYDDSAFVAGARYGQDYAELKASMPPVWQQYVYPEMIDQYDLLAMHLGYEMAADPWDEHPDEWVLVTFTKIAHA